MNTPVLRVSILTVPPENLAALEKLFAAAEPGLQGIKKLPGYLGFWCGFDRKNSRSLNVSIWQTEADAARMDSFQPMLDLGKEALKLNCTFLRPIPNFEKQWAWDQFS